MSKTIRLLAALALIQILLSVLAMTTRTTVSGPPPGKPLLSFERSAIDRITLEAHENGETARKKIVLERHNGQWQTSNGFPADAHKIDRLLDKLAKLEAGLPVATSEAALERFRLDEQGFERRITLASHDQPAATFLLGSGAGARRAYARRGGDNAVVTVALGPYDLPVKPADWPDKTVLQLKKEAVQALTLGDLTVTRGNEQPDGPTTWTTDARLEEGKTLNHKAIDEAVAALGTLRFEKVLGTENKPEYGLDQPALAFQVKTRDATLSWRLGKGKAGRVLHVSNRKEYFKLADYTADSLMQKFSEKQWIMDEPHDAETNVSNDPSAREQTTEPPA